MKQGKLRRIYIVKRGYIREPDWRFFLSQCAADFSLLNLPKGKSLGRILMIFCSKFCLVLLLQIFVYIFSIYLCIFLCANIFGSIVLKPRFKIDVVIMIV